MRLVGVNLKTDIKSDKEECRLKRHAGRKNHHLKTTFSAPKLILVFAFVAGIMSIISYWNNFLPANYYLKAGDKISSGMEMPEPLLKNMVVHLSSTNKILSSDGNTYDRFRMKPGEAAPVALGPGQLNMQLKLFGLIPIHRLMVDVVSPVKVIPGGQSIGVLLHSEGVMVVGEAGVDNNGRKIYPAKDVGIIIGDLILTANGKKISNESELQEIINESGIKGQFVHLSVKHGNVVKQIKIKPALCSETGRYRIGIFVKNSTAGVGTMTFYEPNTQTYGALGHIITDYSGKGTINTNNGRIVEASVKGLQRGEKGEPGEKMGVFKGKSEIIGNIEKNTRHGIFGKLEQDIKNPYFNKVVPVAFRYQIKQGPAEILTVLEDSRIEKFSIEIIQVLPGNNNKGLVIKVTDPELIRRSGGIVQGMSGSPIMQKGRLVGAVTHVFINDPTRGYGVLAENMLKEANLINDKIMEKKVG